MEAMLDAKAKVRVFYWITFVDTLYQTDLCCMAPGSSFVSLSESDQLTTSVMEHRGLCHCHHVTCVHHLVMGVGVTLILRVGVTLVVGAVITVSCATSPRHPLSIQHWILITLTSFHPSSSFKSTFSIFFLPISDFPFSLYFIFL